MEFSEDLHRENKKGMASTNGNHETVTLLKTSFQTQEDAISSAG